MTPRILLCTDLDRTLIPNGPQSESVNARKIFTELVSRDELTLTYVTGRHLEIIEQAIKNYQLPVPDYIIADVGSTIYQSGPDGWTHWQEWENEISPCWANKSHYDIKALLGDISFLRMQEMQKQNTHKLSYYVPLQTDHEKLINEIDSRLQQAGVKAAIIWSIDEPAAIGLLDIVPANVSKKHAIEFLMEKQNFNIKNTVFSGDSGNDLQVIASPIQSILVANASDKIKSTALEQTRKLGIEDTLYIARGAYMGMNGNYSAGVIEGLVHFIPETEEWVKALI